MSEVELAYAAGLIDGEGCIGIYKNSHNGAYQLRITVEMTDRSGIDLLDKLFGGKHYNKEAKPPRKHRFVWMVFNSAAQDTLRRLHPYFRVKVNQATVALKADWTSFIGRPLTHTESEIRQLVWGEMRQLNKRGFYDDKTDES